MKTINVAELMGIPKPPMLVEGLVMERGLVMLMSYSGVGKTFLALDLGIAVAAGIKALDKFVVEKHGKVLYVGEDSPDWDVKEQFGKLCRAKGLKPSDFDHPIEFDEDGEVDVESGDQFRFSINEGMHLNSDAGAAQIVQYVRENGVKLVILDTLSALHAGNGNDGGWMGPVMKRIQAIREHAAVILLHHTAKPGEYDRPGATAAMGATQIGASLDGALTLRAKHGRIEARIAKQRAIRLTEFDYVCEWDDDIARLVVIENDSTSSAELLAALKAAGTKGMTRAAMLEVVKGTLPGGTSDAILGQRWFAEMRRLMAEGKVVKIRRGVYRASLGA